MSKCLLAADSWERDRGGKEGKDRRGENRELLEREGDWRCDERRKKRSE